MYTLLKPIAAREELLERNIRVFTAVQFALLFQLSKTKTKYFLGKFIEEGLLTRLKRGLYALKTDLPQEGVIANALYKPSYVSFDYALAYYGIIPEMVYEVTSATTKPTRLFNTDTLVFSYYSIKPESYTGYTLKGEEKNKFYIAEPEKALVDYLYGLSLGKRGLRGDRSINDRLQLGKLDLEKIHVYAGLFVRPQLNKLIDKVLKEQL